MITTPLLHAEPGLQFDAYGDPEAPTVVLLHAAGENPGVWKETAQALVRAGRYAVSPELLSGTGDFHARTLRLRSLLSKMPTRPVLVGSGLGAAMALAALGGADEPLALGMVIVGVAPDFDPATAAEYAPELARLSRDRGLDTRWIREMDLDHLRSMIEAALSKFRLPLLVLRGEDSRLVSPQALERIIQLAPQAEVATIPEAGHAVVRERAEAFQGLLLSFLETHAPLAPRRYEGGADPRTLRDALGCFATGVTVVTAREGDGPPVGLTASSFTSVSLDPPLLLVCIAKSAGSLPVLEQAGSFCVNVLHIGQQPISDRFARRGEDRFSVGNFEIWEEAQAPVLSGSLASFLCRTVQVHDGGDHRIFVGEVLRARFEPRRDPLLYFRGRYRRLHFA